MMEVEMKWSSIHHKIIKKGYFNEEWKNINSIQLQYSRDVKVNSEEFCRRLVKLAFDKFFRILILNLVLLSPTMQTMWGSVKLPYFLE